MGDKDPLHRIPILITGMEKLESHIYKSMLNGKGFKESVGVVGTIGRKIIDDIFIERKIIGLYLARHIEAGHKKIIMARLGDYPMENGHELTILQDNQILRLNTLLCLISLMRLYIRHYHKDSSFSLTDCGLTEQQLETYWEKAKEKTGAQKKLPPPA